MSRDGDRREWEKIDEKLNRSYKKVSMTPTTLLFGATSILGFNLARMFSETVLPFTTPSNNAKAVRHWPALNLGDPGWAAALFRKHEPETLLYCHAVCDVPRCEIAPGWAREINIGYLSRVMDALPRKTRLVYVSSDHVFGGDGVYDELSAPCPVSVYGRTRVEAEEIVLSRSGSLVLRVGLAIGPSPSGRTGHWDWLRYRTAQKLPMTLVHDEYRSVVWAHDLAVRVMQLAGSGEAGVRHITATRALSRVELAYHLMSHFGLAAEFQYESRHQRAAPHLGRVELATGYRGALFQPLASVIDQRPADWITV
jgi:dTDP-4-dehydrorhamnose reductase